MHPMKNTAGLLCVCLLATATSTFATTRRGVVINEQRLYRDSSVESKTVGRVTVGEEVSITGHEGELLEVSAPGKNAGWTLANGVVVLDDNPRAPALLFEAAESVAREDSPEVWRAAARLFRKAASLGHDGPYAPEARWRAAELAWRIEARTKAAISPSGAVAELAGVVRAYPKTRPAAEADFLLLRTGLCEYWEGTPGCPEAEIEMISQYLEKYSDSRRTAELRYALAYRHAALVEIYLQQGQLHFSAEKAVEHKAKARGVVESLLRQKESAASSGAASFDAASFDASWAARGERLLWSLDHNIGVFSGIEVALRRF